MVMQICVQGLNLWKTMKKYYIIHPQPNILPQIKMKRKK